MAASIYAATVYATTLEYPVIKNVESTVATSIIYQQVHLINTQIQP